MTRWSATSYGGGIQKKLHAPGTWCAFLSCIFTAPCLGVISPYTRQNCTECLTDILMEGSTKRLRGAAAGIVHSESVSKEREKHSTPEYSYKRIYSTQK